MNQAHGRWVTFGVAAAILAAAFSARADNRDDPFRANPDTYPITTPTLAPQTGAPAPAPAPAYAQPNPQAPAPMPQNQYPWAPWNNEVQDYPAADVRAVATARAGAVKARWEYYRAQDNLYQTVDFLREDFKDSSAHRAAQSAADSAHDQLDTIRRRVLGKLADDPKYQALRKLRDQTDEQIQRLRAQRPAAEADITAAAQLKMQYNRRLSEMEHDALIDDPEYREARARLAVAGQDLAQMRSDFERGIRRDQDFREARRDWEDARIDFVVAATYRDALIESRNIALTFAYNLHYYDLYRNLNMSSWYPWSFNGGFGFGSPVFLGFTTAPISHDHSHDHGHMGHR